MVPQALKPWASERAYAVRICPSWDSVYFPTFNTAKTRWYSLGIRAHVGLRTCA